MNGRVILDTGPLVALLNTRDKYHKWSVEKVRNLATPMFTCEAVITEAIFLLGHTSAGISKVVKVLEKEDVRITQSLALKPERKRVCEILMTYSNLPASLADACLVRMSENHPKRKVFTLDSHFHIYRRNDTEPIPLLIPN